MKKKLVGLCLIAVLVCSGIVIIFKYFIASQNINNYEFSENKFIDTSHPNSNVKIKYPQINQEDKEKTNALIKNYAESLAANIYREDYSDLDLDFSYRIAFYNDEWLSVVFEGDGYVSTAAYPNKLLYALNINLEDSSIVSFSDLYYSDSKVLQIVKDNFNKQFVPNKLKELGIDSDNDEYETLKNQLSTVGIYSGKDTLGDETIFYLSDTSVVICPELCHAIGDYFEIDVKYSELTNYQKTNKKSFK